MPNKYNSISPGNTGFIAELRVLADLMTRGYSVYKSISPNASYDILILKDDKISRVEVKSGHYDNNGNVVSTALRKDQRGGVHAIYIHDTNQVFYRPPLDPVLNNPDK